MNINLFEFVNDWIYINFNRHYTEPIKSGIGFTWNWQILNRNFFETTFGNNKSGNYTLLKLIGTSRNNKQENINLEHINLGQMTMELNEISGNSRVY